MSKTDFKTQSQHLKQKVQVFGYCAISLRITPNLHGGLYCSVVVFICNLRGPSVPTVRVLDAERLHCCTQR